MKKILPVFFLCLSLVTKAQIPPYVSVNGLAAWYSFDGNANDGSGNGHNGTVQNAALCPDRFNQPSSAYYFGGSNQQIICSNDTSVTNHTNFSVSLWFSVDNRPGGWEQNVMISNIGTFNASGGFEIFTSNPPNADITGMFRPATYADQSLQTIGLVNIDSAQWNHIVYTLHYITAEDSTQASIYLNGNFIKSQKFFHSISYSGITPLLIGTNIDSIGWQRAFKGKIDDIGLWNRELTQQEINDLYNAINTATEEVPAMNSLRIYPNPASEFVNLLISSKTNSAVRSTISDLSGQILKESVISTNQMQTISLEGFSPAIYFLRIENDGKYFTQKIVVIK